MGCCFNSGFNLGKYIKWGKMRIIIKLITYIFLLSIIITNVYATLEDDTVSYYKYDNNVLDSAASYDATNYGATSNPSGLINQAYSYDGNNDYIRASSMLTGFPFTINFWMKSTAMQYGYIIFLGYSGSDIVYYGFQISNSGIMELHSRNLAGTEKVISSTALNDGDWHMVTGIWRSATDRELYIDTVSERTGTNSVTYNSNVDRFTTGRLDRASPATYYLGLVDEVAVTNTAATTADIAEWWNGGSGIQYPYSSVDINVTQPLKKAHIFQYYNSTTNSTTEIFYTLPTGHVIFNNSIAINTTQSNTTAALLVNGNILARGYNDYTDWFDKDKEKDKYSTVAEQDAQSPKEIIKAIKKDSKGHIDHDSLHPFLQYHDTEKYIDYKNVTLYREECYLDITLFTRNRTRCVQVPYIHLDKVEKERITGTYRSVNNQVTMNVVVLQEIIIEMEELKQELCLFDKRYSWC